MKQRQVILVVLINLFIAIGFFLENRGVGFTQMSSDMYNSTPVCFKLDDESLFQKDLYLHDTKNVKYYTPFYIETVRFFAQLTGGNYLAGLNIFATFLHLIYGLTWFLLFSRLFRHFWLALVLSILVRGIVWLPGFEIWGISDLWTMMPRTMYIAFMPIPFLLLLNKTRRSLYAASLVLGLIFNFHPITGMGGVLMFALVIFFYCYLYKVKLDVKTILFATFILIVGMLPFLNTYFSQTDSAVVYDVELYKKAFSSRIPYFFVDPPAFVKLWLGFKTLFFFIPLLGYFLYGRLIDKEHLKPATLLVAVSVLTIVICSISVYVENAVNASLGLNIRMAFQIIRAQKLAILPGVVAIGFLVKIVLDKNLRIQSYFKIIAAAFLMLLLFSKEAIFNKVPFFKDDIARSVFPDYRLFFESAGNKQIELDKMFNFISKNTASSDVFYGDGRVRAACRRSVVLDSKGASMLIEGNPVELIQWYTENQHLEQLSPTEKISYLKNKKSVTHILAQDSIVGNVTLLHREGKHRLYKIN